MAMQDWNEVSKGSSKMIMHRGGKYLTRRELEAVPLPVESEGDGRGYAVVPHLAVIDLVDTRLQKEFGVPKESISWTFATSHEGQRLFAMAALLKEPDPKAGILPALGEKIEMRDSGEWGPAFALRNSYDKSMSFGFSVGLRVMICDNLSISGDFVTYTRAHTGNAMQEIMNQIVTGMSKAETQIRQLSKELTGMQNQELDLIDGYRLLGQAFGTRILTAHQFGAIMRSWTQPESPYGPRSAYRLYNEITEVLKGSKPNHRFGRQGEAHRLLLQVQSA